MAESVAPGTRSRGSADAARPGRLAWFLALAAVLHLPLTPVGALLGLLGLLRLPTHEPPPEALNAIPISLLSPEEIAQLGGEAKGPARQPATPEPSPPKPVEDEPAALPDPEQPKPKPKPKPRSKPKPTPLVADGGTPDGGPSKADERPQEKHDGGGLGDAGARPAVTEHPEGPQAADPMALVGKAASVADPNANVKLLLMNDRIRGLSVGPRIGRLVARLPQWSSFFGPTTLDPIRDIDRMYVAGPQFRVSAEVVAVLQYGVPNAAMRTAIDAIVKREPKGEWLSSKIPAARARADRADRVFVLPKGKVLLMVPPHLADDAIDKASHLALPQVGGSAAVVAFVATPWRALAGLRVPLEIPKTIASVALLVTPSEDGGVVLHIDAVDDSNESAKDHAGMLTTAINAVTQQNVGALGALLFGGQTLSLVEPIELRAEGKTIRGDARVTPRQLDRLLGFAEAWVDAITGGPPPIPASASTTSSKPSKPDQSRPPH